jgi:hypothetical protein
MAPQKSSRVLTISSGSSIPVNAEVYCADGRCGRSITVILNPVTDKVTHMVVAERGLLGIEHIVPLDQVVETTPTSIRLRSSAADLTKLDSFVEAHFIGGEEPYEGYAPGTWVLWPYLKLDKHGVEALPHIPVRRSHS